MSLHLRSPPGSKEIGGGARRLCCFAIHTQGCSSLRVEGLRFNFLPILLSHNLSPPRSLVRDGQTSPHRPRLVVSRSTCPPLSPSPHANSFIIGTAVISKDANPWVSRGLGRRMHLGVEVTESSTNKQHDLSVS
jgi:hypothetical protein